MKNKKWKPIAALALAVSVCAIFTMTGCSSASADTGVSSAAVLSSGSSQSGTSTVSGTGIVNGEELFTERDLEHTPDLSEAETITLTDETEIDITEEGVYVLQGSAKNCLVLVDAEDTAKIQLVLDGVSIENESIPCIYVRSADKVFVTTVADSSLTVTGSFYSDGETATDGVIFSKDDLVLNGTAKLTVNSSDNGIVGKDDLKFTGGTYVITASSKCVEANDSIRIADGSFTLKAGTDCLHAENDEDDSLGYVYIGGGSFSLDAGDDGIHGNAFVQIDGGSLQISAAEGIEGTYVQINGGTISIQSWDDGINAARKSSAYTPTVEIAGGTVTITMGAGDTDGIDANGNILISGGTVSITGSSPFDYEGSASFTGGTVYVNGQQVNSLPNQMMGGEMGGMGSFGGQGGFGGGPGGPGGFGGGPGGPGGFGGGPGGGRP